MNKRFSALLIASLILSSVSVFAQKAPAKAAAKVEALPTQKTPAKESESNVLPTFLTMVLEQVSDARLDFGVQGKFKSRAVDGKTTSATEFTKLDFNAKVSFKDQFSYKFAEKKQNPSQFAELIPHISFNTKNMDVVVNAEIRAAGKLKIRFCQNYTPGTTGQDHCNTGDDKKLLEVVVKSKTLQNIYTLHLKSIEATFSKNISGTGKFEFSGTCDAYKRMLTPGASEDMTKIDCSVKGILDSDKGTKDIEFTFM